MDAVVSFWTSDVFNAYWAAGRSITETGGFERVIVQVIMVVGLSGRRTLIA